jgi:hypothetical protein
MGMGGMGGMGMGSLMTQAAEEEEESTPYILQVVLEVEHKNIHSVKSDLRRYFRHKWGITYLP